MLYYKNCAGIIVLITQYRSQFPCTLIIMYGGIILPINLPLLFTSTQKQVNCALQISRHLHVLLSLRWNWIRKGKNSMSLIKTVYTHELYWGIKSALTRQINLACICKVSVVFFVFDLTFSANCKYIFEVKNIPFALFDWYVQEI